MGCQSAYPPRHRSLMIASWRGRFGPRVGGRRSGAASHSARARLEGIENGVLSQRRCAARVGLTQKSAHRIERGAVCPSMRAIDRAEESWHRRAVPFEGTIDSGFRLVADAAVLVALCLRAPEASKPGNRHVRWLRGPRLPLLCRQLPGWLCCAFPGE